ncbi:aquaporin PIP2-7-like [Hevea brasiliensis]|uniref:aquaporin PIP2-7-like n=1 Tax=Hevea brasiliensis TaxID=3981 RepID=UPI0025D17C93|nr:aquaporin PIP2-7-like [Hevea brasiliensis]
MDLDLVLSHDAGNQAFPNQLDGQNKNIKDSLESPKKTFLSCIGVHELLSPETWKAAITELVSTACLLFTLITMVTACLESHVAEPKLLVPVVVFSTIFLLLVVTIPVSGGHMNPTLTFIFALKGVITFVRALVYILAQCLGSTMAYLIVKRVMNPKIAEKYSLGGCGIGGNGEGISAGTALAIEFVGYGGARLNPARCIGPAVLVGGSLWESLWVFWETDCFGLILIHNPTCIKNLVCTV